MKIEELAAKVKAMRDLQKRYFKERGPIILQDAKQAERDVDRAVERILNPDLQGKLFE